MVKDNTLKKADPKGEHSAKEKVEKTVDIRKELTQEEAQKLVDQANGVEQKETVTEPTEKIGEKGEVKTETITEIPERYRGKTPEELVKILDEKEKFIQSRSDEIGDWKQKVKEADKLNEKIAKIEEEAMKQSQQPANLPKRPVAPVLAENEYYDDPAKAMNKLLDYNRKLADYVDQITSAKTAPFYQSDMERKRGKLYEGLEEKYKDYPVKFDRKKVQEFLQKNPGYFNQYKTKAYEQAYHDMSAEDFTRTHEEENAKLREQVKKEIIEEIKTQRQAGEIGLSDLETPQAGSAVEYDTGKMEEDPEYRNKVIADMEKRNR